MDDDIRNPSDRAPDDSEGTAEPARADETVNAGAGAAPPATAKRSPVRTAVEWGVLLVGALVIALIVKAFLFQAFYIPSDSMVPTLKNHDRVIVNKVSYRMHDVHRGDIVVFTTPKGPDGQPFDPTIKDLVKRVVGIPGDTVGERNGHVTIDGKPLDESYLPAGTITDCTAFKAQCFPTGPLPKDHYWVMGDNRAGSRDSRYFGTITKSSIVGRVMVRVWPLNRLHIF